MIFLPVKGCRLRERGSSDDYGCFAEQAHRVESLERSIQLVSWAVGFACQCGKNDLAEAYF